MPKANDTPLTEEQRRLAEDNHALTYFAVRKFRGPKRDVDRLHSAAQEGLVMAARSYKPTSGCTFATYAVHAMTRAMERETQDGLIRVPAYQFENRKNLGSVDRYKADAKRARKVVSIHKPSEKAGLVGRRVAKSSLRYDPPDHRGRVEADDEPTRERQREQLDAIHAAIEQLRPSLRRTFKLHLQGLSDAEIAREAGIGYGTAYGQVRDARSRIRLILGLRSQAG